VKFWFKKTPLSPSQQRFKLAKERLYEFWKRQPLGSHKEKRAFNKLLDMWFRKESAPKPWRN
jgi:hypothetical protein